MSVLTRRGRPPIVRRDGNAFVVTVGGRQLEFRLNKAGKLYPVGYAAGLREHEQGRSDYEYARSVINRSLKASS